MSDPIHIDSVEAFASMLRARRAELGLTLAQAGELVGMDPGQVSVYELGRRRAGLAVGLRFLDGYGLALWAFSKVTPCDVRTDRFGEH